MNPVVDAEVIPAIDSIAAAFRVAHQAQAKAACTTEASKMLAGLGRGVAALQERIRMADAVAGNELRAIPGYNKVSMDLFLSLADLLDIVRDALSRIEGRRAERNRAQHMATAAVIDLCLRAGIPVSKGNDGVAAQILDHVFRSGGYYITEPRKWIASAANKLPSTKVDRTPMVLL